MFNENQQEKIKEFATYTKLTNHCFDICVNDSFQNEKISSIEKNCLEKCSESYIDMHSNFKKFLTEVEDKYINSDYKKGKIRK